MDVLYAPIRSCIGGKEIPQVPLNSKGLKPGEAGFGPDY